MLSTKGMVSLIGISMSHSCPSWRFQRLSLVDQLCFLDSGNVDIVAVEEIQQFSYSSADPFKFHCISRRQLVGVGVEAGPGFIPISPAH